MSYSNTFCRKCEKNTYVNLEDSNMLCASCIREINTPEPADKVIQEVDVIIHKNIRWLQSWLLIEGITSTSAYLYWRSPKYKDAEFNVKNYLIQLVQTNESYLVSGDRLGYKLQDLTPGTTYNVRLDALDKNDSFVNITLKKKFTTANVK